jgi:sec-independent protein translocase protein TatC
MARALRPVGHEDRLSLIEHLDELRTRLIVCALALAVAFGIAVWQNHALLDAANRPLERTTAAAAKRGSPGQLGDTARAQVAVRQALARGATAFERLARGGQLDAAQRRELLRAARSYDAAVAALPKQVPGRQPVTLGVGEPFGTTVTVSFYIALLFALPLILYQLYAFVMPAFSPEERRIVRPLMLLVPALFAAGVAFGYFVVLPPAIRFLQTFNSSSFDVLVQARPYYSFVTLTLLSLGVLFQIPVAVLALTRAGVLTTQQLRRNRRYAIVVIAVVAMLLPGTDPVTTLIEMVPLVILYELSILLARWLDRVSAERGTADSLAVPDSDETTPDAV